MAEIVPEGKFLAHAVDAALTKSSNKGTEQAEVIYSIDEGDFVGRVVGWRGFFTEATYEGTLEALYASGLPDTGNPSDDVPNIEALTADPKQVQIVVQHEPSQDGEKTYARVRWVNKLGNAKIKEEVKLDDSGKRGFAAKLASLTGKPASGNKPKPKPKPAPAAAATAPKAAPKAAPAPRAAPVPAPIDDSDIPF